MIEKITILQILKSIITDPIVKRGSDFLRINNGKLKIRFGRTRHDLPDHNGKSFTVGKYGYYFHSGLQVHLPYPRNNKELEFCISCVKNLIEHGFSDKVVTQYPLHTRAIEDSKLITL